MGSPMSGAAQDGWRRPFPTQTSYAEGSLRPDHRSQEEQDDVVRAAYERWKERYFVEAGYDAIGNPLYRIAFGRPESENYWVTVSEGQGYGMVIVAYLAGHDPNARSLFDGLWRFARANPSAVEPRLMSWRVPPGDGRGQDSAFDGDCDIAYGLLLADAQWGSDGPIDYATEAREVIAGMLAATVGPSSRLPMLGDWVEADGAWYNEYTPRTSDFMPGHFRAFQRATDDPWWEEVVAACHQVVSSLQQHYSPETGLLPDFVQPVSDTNRSPRPANPDFLEGPHDDAFGYNAGRTPWRLGVDALLSGDERSRSQAGAMAAWAEGATGGDPHALSTGYFLDGQPIDPDGGFTTFFAAPLGVAAMTTEFGQAWLNALFDSVADRSEGYYEDSVTLLCLLVMTGNWWDPTAE
jgi:endo-1,4-beta-D-glucanase Y